MEEEYRPVVWRLPNSWMSREAFERSVMAVEMTSSPGLPYMREATTNGQWLKWDGVSCDQYQLDRLWHDVQLVFADEWEHLLRVFIKQEPHKLQKCEQRRWRLIMASSLSVQVAWHMTFGYLNDLEIDRAYEIPSQHGLQIVGGNWKTFYNQWTNSGHVCGLDKQAWDWTMPYWAIELDLEFRFRLGRGGKMGEWHSVAKMLYRHMFVDPIIVLSDGSMFKQTVPGIMKSGCVNTISTNGHGQGFIHILVCTRNNVNPLPLPKSCGDDTLQREDQLVSFDEYAQFGVRVKSVSTTIEFIGKEWRLSGPRPLYMGKHLVKVCYVKDENMDQYLDGMAREYCHVDDCYRFWEQLAENMGKDLPMSQSYYRFWYDFET